MCHFNMAFHTWRIVIVLRMWRTTLLNIALWTTFRKLCLHCASHSLIQLNPFWEVANCAATQELPGFLWNPKVHCRVHKSPPLVPIQSKINPIHTIPFCLSKIYVLYFGTSLLSVLSIWWLIGQHMGYIIHKVIYALSSLSDHMRFNA
jgi:hypothetical protein